MAASAPRVVSFGKAGEAGLPPKGTPKNYLMAWLLVMLAEKNLHGYEITKELNEKFDVITDAGTVYRALRQLERDGYISSWWDPNEQGPAAPPLRVDGAGQRRAAALERSPRAIPREPGDVLRALSAPQRLDVERKERRLSRLPISVLFLGSGGARFVVARQLRASGGMWMRFGETQIHVDPGPGALVRALTHVPPCNPRELDAIVLSHKHLDHSGDVNAMVEAMTSGGFRPRGTLLAPGRCLRSTNRSCLPYAQAFRRTHRAAGAERAAPIASAASNCARRVAHVHAVADLRPAFRARRAARLVSAVRTLLRRLGRRLRAPAARRADRQRAALSRRDGRRSPHVGRRVPRRRRRASAKSPSSSTSARRCSRPIRQRLAQVARRRARPARDRRLRRFRRSTSTPRSRRLPVEIARVRPDDVRGFYRTHEREALRALYDFSVVWHEQMRRFRRDRRRRRSSRAATIRIAARWRTSSASSSLPDTAPQRHRPRLLDAAADVANYYNCHKMSALVPHESAGAAISSKPAATAKRRCSRSTRSNSTSPCCESSYCNGSGYALSAEVAGDGGGRRRRSAGSPLCAAALLRRRATLARLRVVGRRVRLLRRRRETVATVARRRRILARLLRVVPRRVVACRNALRAQPEPVRRAVRRRAPVRREGLESRVTRPARADARRPSRYRGRPSRVC